jgi:hypothetical protein
MFTNVFPQKLRKLSGNKKNNFFNGKCVIWKEKNRHNTEDNPQNTMHPKSSLL